MKNKEAKKVIDAIDVVKAGLSKLAEISKTASAPSEETTKKIDEQANRVASKLAEFGYGTQSDVEANSATMASSHEMALQACEDILDGIVGPSVKEGSSPSALGQPANQGPAPSLREKQKQAYRPPRC